MGGIVSTGHNNDDLIDNLLEVDYIKTSIIERVFRAVDRAEYFLPEGRGNAYKDVAWKSGNLHLSAPCIYSEVMEGLCLEPGLSFLNLGSGTGYLSTMVGLILGRNGINHGIEVYDDVVQYANKKLEEFKKYSGAIDEYDFCEPTFVTGNCLCLRDARMYDRVYCGASCPTAFEPYMKSLLKIGGILVVPINEHLIQFKRVSERKWASKTLLPVSFASLVQPPDGSQDTLTPIEIQPKSLQNLSRSAIRNILRKNIEFELPVVQPKRGPPKKTPRRKKMLKRFIVPLFDDDDSSDDEQPQFAFAGRNGLRGRANLNNDYENFFSHVIDTLRFRGGNQQQKQRSAETQTGDEETEENQEEQEVAVVGGEEDAGVAMDVGSERDDMEGEEETQNNTAGSMVVNDGSACSDISCDEHKRDLNLDPSGWADSSESEPTYSRREKSKNERKKVDSGLGDENEILEVSEEEEEEDEEDENNDSSSDEDDDKSKRAKRSNRHSQENQGRPKWRRITLEPSLSSSSESENEHEQASRNNEMRMYKSRFTQPMKDKIQELPLPQILKNYLNFYRD